MVSKVKLGRSLRPREEQWLVQKVGPRLHYLPNSIGGIGWLAKREEGKTSNWYLSFEDDKLASYFVLKFL
jgi:hypothetical protein